MSPTITVTPRILESTTKHGPAAKPASDTGNPTLQVWHYRTGDQTESRSVIVGGLRYDAPIRVRCAVQRRRLADAGATGWRA
jgi:hypothetical protein